MLIPTEFTFNFSSDLRRFNHVMIGEQLRFSPHFSLLYGIVIGTESTSSSQVLATSQSTDSAEQKLKIRVPPPVFSQGIHFVVGFSYFGNRVVLPVHCFETDSWSWKFSLLAFGLCLLNKAVSFSFSFLKYHLRKKQKPSNSRKKYNQDIEDYKAQVVCIENNLATLDLTSEFNHHFYVIKA